ncbi:MAG: triose-phosphate isomerase [Anaerolineales bacterium]|nr:triose-phosphate isomerase [Anaerolineales bacterium]
MRKPLVAGNWKMNLTVAESRHLVSEMIPGLQSIEGVDRVICPPFTSLLAVSALLEGTAINLGAQNLYWESAGAFTGEISPLMLSELARFVILGHSERRMYFNETDSTVNKKVQAALAHALTPIVCVGETLEEYEAGLTEEVVSRQIRLGLAGLDLRIGNNHTSPLVIAYEPVWAIGTGRAATPEDVNVIIARVIRAVLFDEFGERISQSTRVLYGGSVNSDNASKFFSEEEIDGALVGGASLKVNEFVKIVQAA